MLVGERVPRCLIKDRPDRRAGVGRCRIPGRRRRHGLSSHNGSVGSTNRGYRVEREIFADEVHFVVVSPSGTRLYWFGDPSSAAAEAWRLGQVVANG